jgi:DNA topoisomerase-1
MDQTMTRDEILTLYSNVPNHYRNAYFWKNFTNLCIKQGWAGNGLQAKSLLKNVTPAPEREPLRDNIDKHKSCYSPETGQEEPITNWRMEPAMVFLGRGNHPLRGSLKRRITPEDVILNLHSSAPVPKLPKGRRWKEVIHKPECEWLWSWSDPLLKKIKYVYPAAVSQTHSEKEWAKFEDAMELGNHIGQIRKFYNNALTRGEYLELACVLYLIDNLGIRIGNEQNTNVEGATTLRKRGVVIMEDRRRVRVQFRGKDSIEYDNQISCSTDFIRAIRTLGRERGDNDYLFPNVTPKIVNEYLQSHHPSLSAKTFRTYNATMKMKEGLERYRPELGDPGEWFRKCATEVAVFCNHKKVSTLKKIKEQYSHVTTITNYIDPRVTCEWAEKNNIPIEKLYSKSLRERFAWAIQYSKENTDGSE